MSEPREQHPKPDKDELADALAAMSDGADVQNEESQEEILADFGSTGRALRPEAPQRSTPAPRAEPEPIAPSNFDRIVEDDNSAVPAPSEAMLAGSAMLHRAATRVQHEPRSVSVQRTIIPILLTLSLLLPGLGIWLLTLSEESQVRATMQNWPMYLFIGGAVALAVAIVNMIQVRTRLRSPQRSAVAGS